MFKLVTVNIDEARTDPYYSIRFHIKYVSRINEDSKYNAIHELIQCYYERLVPSLFCVQNYIDK